ncbi:mycobacterial-type methylenetetrahydrofolate reductase [Williamsia sterculiae]|uniref:Methylenetetrahydrofolate reductase n=1 Tax=Williamsia sterculiae TaxID=1344003 RepID=A0A1N7G838_9NOCA|nr:mycobacterial-type methylenetetrahydrofolate reductase [Williamsia sterculiae]SIS08664.1 hypothetical protein SAMN05445060_2580 [Williamsia sterculiae]
MPLNTIALELVPPNLDRGADHARAEGAKVLRLAEQVGMSDRIGHVMIPGMIDEDDDRPVAMTPKFDVLDFWSLISPELPGVRGLCTQVTPFLQPTLLRERITRLSAGGFDGMIFVGVPRTMNDGDGSGIAPVEALSEFCDLVDHRGSILIPTRDNERERFRFKCDAGATFAMTQLLYSDTIVDFLTDFARTSDHRPDVLLSFGFVPSLEERNGLIRWLIQDPGNDAVRAEQALVGTLARSETGTRQRLMLDLYQRVIDGVGQLGFPMSVHFESPYGITAAAFDTFARMLDYWSPDGHGETLLSR